MDRVKPSRPWHVFLLNLCWFAACLPGAVQFVAAALFPGSVQRRLLKNVLRRNTNTAFGQQHKFTDCTRCLEEFAKIPVQTYEGFRPWIEAIQRGEASVLTVAPVRMLQPTSGTTATSKLIPWTDDLRRDFQRALSPWIASLYLLHPALLLGRQYWCVSPNTRARESGSAVKVGFADDTEYVGGRFQQFISKLLVTPPELARVEDPDTFEFLTLLLLARERNLRLISIWHPSFLALLLDKLPRRANEVAACLSSGVLPQTLVLSEPLRALFNRHLWRDSKRAREVADCVRDAAAVSRLWPKLCVISCWTMASAEPWLARIAAALPGASFQGKGLLATEAVTTVPIGPCDRTVAAVRSHFYEFIDEDGRVKHLWDVPPGRVYELVVTTSGGLYRYRSGDRVRISGRRWLRLPVLEFCGRADGVSDICGEKVSMRHAEEALDCFRAASGLNPELLILVPDRIGTPHYICYLEVRGIPTCGAERHGDAVEHCLLRNVHYAHARGLGQLSPVEVVPLRPGAAHQYRAHLASRGLRYGDIKFPALRTEDEWHECFARFRWNQCGREQLTERCRVLHSPQNSSH